jgi:nucleoid DNA-binding protein
MLPTRQIIDKDELMEKVSQELNIPLQEVKRIWKFQFEEMSKHIINKKENKFRLMGIGALIQKHKPNEKYDALKDFEL